jgi:hypothetical protein
MGGGLLSCVPSFVPGILVKFSSLSFSTFSIGKSLSGAKSYSLPPAVGFGKLEVASSVSWWALIFRVSVCLSEFVLFCLRNIFLSRFHAARLKAVSHLLVCRSRPLASHLSTSYFDLLPFPFTLGEFLKSCPISTIEARTRSICIFAFGWFAINFSYLWLKDASTSRQRVSHFVSVARTISLKHNTL